MLLNLEHWDQFKTNAWSFNKTSEIKKYCLFFILVIILDFPLFLGMALINKTMNINKVCLKHNNPIIRLFYASFRRKIDSMSGA